MLISVCQCFSLPYPVCWCLYNNMGEGEERKCELNSPPELSGSCWQLQTGMATWVSLFISFETLTQFTLSSKCHYQSLRKICPNTEELQTVPFCPFSPPVTQSQMDQSFQILSSTPIIPFHSHQLSLVACIMVLVAASRQIPLTDAKYLTAGLACYSWRWLHSGRL